MHAILMRNVLRPAENHQENMETSAENHQDNMENGGYFRDDETVRGILPLRWSTDLRQLPELNFIQFYDWVYRNILNSYLAHHVFRYGLSHAIRASQPSPLTKS